MKIKNDMGNRYEGSVGHQVTAASWKGRNYIKKYTKPANPNTVNQQRVRGYFAAGVALWKGFNNDQKGAYADKTRADKTNISAFNTMVSNYVRILNAGEDYNEPIDGTITVKDAVAGLIEGAIITIRKSGQSTDYQVKITDAAGEATAGLTREDQNYDLSCSAPGYVTYTDNDLVAIQVWRDHADIVLADA